MPAKRYLLASSGFFLLLFLVLSFFVIHGRFENFDFNTTVKIQNHLPASLDFIFSILSLIGTIEITTAIWLIILIILITKHLFKVAFLFPLFFVGTLVELIGKIYIKHPAPPFLFYRGVINFNFPSSYVSTDSSYPSGHMARTSFLVIFLILWINSTPKFTHKLIAIIGLLVFLVLMAISRIDLGEHWTSDVLGGILLGTFLAILTGFAMPQTSNQGIDKN